MDALKPTSSSPVSQDAAYLEAAAPLRYRLWSPTVASKPTLVLIHGLFGDMDSWPSLIPAVLRQGFGVVCIELPSHGQSPCMAESFEQTVEVVAQTVEAALQSIAGAQPGSGPGPDPSLIVLGHSLGAAIATCVARRLDPGRLKSLLLMSPAGCGSDINQAFVEGMLDADDNHALEHEINKLTVVPFGLDEAYLDSYRARLKSQRADLRRLCATVSVNAVQKIDILPDLDELTCPITIVHGREDRIIPWQHALNAPPQVALHIVPRVGHIPYEEAPALVHRVLLRV